MVKVFRKNRFKLLEKNKTKKYLKYAIGEILLVVIGILIALSINNWNENQKNRKQELSFIVEINKEFKENKIKLDKVVSEHRSVLENCEALINFFPISLEKTSSDTISNLVQGTWIYAQYNPSQNAINSLVGLPSFPNMKNSALRDVLSSWKVVLENFQSKENNAAIFCIDRFDPFLNDNFHYDFDLNDPRTDLTILNSFKFENLIKERAWKQYSLLERDSVMVDLESNINEIILLTDKEIADSSL